MHFIPFGPKPEDSLSQNVKHLSYKDLAYTFDRKHRFYERKKQISHFRQGNRVQKDVAKTWVQKQLIFNGEIYTFKETFIFIVTLKEHIEKYAFIWNLKARTNESWVLVTMMH